MDELFSLLRNLLQGHYSLVKNEILVILENAWYRVSHFFPWLFHYMVDEVNSFLLRSGLFFDQKYVSLVVFAFMVAIAILFRRVIIYGILLAIGYAIFFSTIHP